MSTCEEVLSHVHVLVSPLSPPVSYAPRDAGGGVSACILPWPLIGLISCFHGHRKAVRLATSDVIRANH